jgi:hypothetical protein
VFIHASSLLLYSAISYEHQMVISLYHHKDEGLVIKIDINGLEMFRELTLFDPMDDYSKGQHITIDNLKPSAEQAIVDFTGIVFELENFYSTILFQFFFQTSDVKRSY